MKRNPRAIEARMAAAANLKEARECVAYWQRQAKLRTDPDAITDAAAHVSLWKTTVAAREATLDSLRTPARR